MKIRITLIDDLLGTKAANKDVFADFIASKAPDDDARKQELDTAEHREEAGTTVFHRNESGSIILWDYQVKGAFIDVEIRLLPGGPVSEAMVRQCLDYGALKGLGQWRNSGKGRFEWKEIA